MTLILTNATIVLPDELLHGTVVANGGRITEIQPGGTGAPGAIDLGGDILLPGAVDLHTDNLERQVEPRRNARWPARSAFLAHDAQCAAAGITTVLDALCLGDLGFEENRERTCIDGIADLDALSSTGLLKCRHLLHLRCELPAIGMPALLDRFADHPALVLVSLMDHTPGAGQYGDLDRYRLMRERDGEAVAETNRRILSLQRQRAETRGPNRAALLARLRGSAIAIASHDDRTEDDVRENLADGLRLSEFPVSLEAATAARAGGMGIIAGAPNLVRGGSHTGNVAALDLLRAGLIDALASDYVPASLIHAAFAAAATRIVSLPQAIALITEAPARMIGLDDRGRLAAGQLADLVRVRVHDGVPVVREVFRGGERVA
jgi:alpha-D-ribose 1-methylphosphonate 5-triphosphate diphosphatase